MKCHLLRAIAAPLTMRARRPLQIPDTLSYDNLKSSNNALQTKLLTNIDESQDKSQKWCVGCVANAIPASV